MGHGFAARESVVFGVELCRAIAILLGRVHEEAAAALKVGAVVGGAAGFAVETEEGLGHLEFGDGASGGARGENGDVIEGAVEGGNVVGGVAAEGSIQCFQDGLAVHSSCIATGRIEGTTHGKDHACGGHRRGFGGSAGDVLHGSFHGSGRSSHSEESWGAGTVAHFDEGTDVEGQRDLLLGEGTTENLRRVPVAAEADGREEIRCGLRGRGHAHY